MTDIHRYEINLQWAGERKGMISSPEIPQKIEIATPPDFPKGIPGFWSPEHLFIAAVCSCLMTTFLSIAESSKFEYSGFECNAIGKVEKVDGKLKVSEIKLMPKLRIPAFVSPERGLRILEMSEKNCLISNSVNSLIHFEPVIEIE